MFSLLASVLNGVSQICSNSGQSACARILLDEPECPKSLIEK